MKSKKGIEIIKNSKKDVIYHINEEKGIVRCTIYKNKYGDPFVGEFVGESVCHPKDEFSKETGMKLAHTRAVIKLKKQAVKFYSFMYSDAKRAANKFLKELVHSQNRIDELRDEESYITGEKYHDEFAGYELLRGAHRNGQLNEEEEKLFKELRAKREKFIIKCSNKSSKKKTENKRDSHGRFVKKSED